MYLYTFDGSLPIRTQNGVTIAHDYTRIVHGGRGAYVEFSRDQIIKESLYDPVVLHYYYKEYRTLDNVKVYCQHHLVSYADYQIGMYYVSPTFLKGFNNTGRKYRMVEV